VRGGKSLAVLAVVLIALVAYIYFVDRKKPASDAAEVKQKAFAVTADQIDAIDIKPATGDATRAEKVNGTWKLVAPEKTDGDQAQISNAVSSLASLEITRVVDENPGDLSQFGLNPPKVDVAFRVKGLKDEKHLLIGEKTATGGDLYARTPDQKRVFLVASFLENTFNRTPFDLRDKSALKFDQTKVNDIEIDHEGTIELTKTADDWVLAKPIKARADFASAEAILTALSGAQMQKIEATESKDLKTYGLDKPDATIVVSAGSTKATLAIGATKDMSVYARDLSRPLIFTLPQTSATDLEKTVDMLRRKDMLDARSFDAARVELHRGTEAIVLDKSKAKDGKDVWKNAAGKQMDTAKVEEMLTKLSSIRANLFQDRVDPVLKMPTLTATIKRDNGKTETVTFARSGNAVLGNRADEPGSATVDVMAFNDAMTAIDAVK
jgi:hypothetical protein